MRLASVFLMAILLAGAVRGTVMTAVLSQVKGNVTVKEETLRKTSSASGSPIRHARFLQTVRAGDEIRVPAGAGAGLVCSNDRGVSLPQGKESRLTKDICLRGTPLPPGTYMRLAPVGGRLQSIRGALVLERKTRAPEDEDFGAPVLLSPRNTSLLDPRPEIVWTPVRGATEYEIELVGSKSFRRRFDASKLPCNRRGDDWGEEAGVCSVPWPKSDPDLPRGETFFLSVGARRSIASDLREEREPSRIQRLTEKQGKEVRSSLEKLAALPLDCEARQILVADVYARAGLLSEAIRAYRKTLLHRETPESLNTLGDVYFGVGLYARADRSYRKALTGGTEPAVRAGAEFGLGRIEYARGSFDRALEHFQTARKLYAGLGLTKESAAAKVGMAQAKKKR